MWHAEEREVAGKRRWEIEEEEKGIIVNLKLRSCFSFKHVELFCQIWSKNSSSSIRRVVRGAKVKKMVSLMKRSRAKCGLTLRAFLAGLLLALAPCYIGRGVGGGGSINSSFSCGL